MLHLKMVLDPTFKFQGLNREIAANVLALLD